MRRKTPDDFAGKMHINQAIALTIAVVLLILAWHRHYSASQYGGHQASPAPSIVVEVAVGDNASEICFFSTVPTLQHVREVCGAGKGEGTNDTVECLRPVDNGTKVTIGAGKGSSVIDCSPMGAAKRLALGISVDANTVTAEDLTLISGIGPVLAREIIRYRAGVGRFETIEQLKNVKGIGEKRFQSIRKYVVVNRER